MSDQLLPSAEAFSSFWGHQTLSFLQFVLLPSLKDYPWFSKILLCFACQEATTEQHCLSVSVQDVFFFFLTRERMIKASEHKQPKGLWMLHIRFKHKRTDFDRWIICLCAFLTKFGWLSQSPLTHSVVENCFNLEAITKICSSGLLYWNDQQAGYMRSVWCVMRLPWRSVSSLPSWDASVCSHVWVCISVCCSLLLGFPARYLAEDKPSRWFCLRETVQLLSDCVTYTNKHGLTWCFKIKQYKLINPSEAFP